MKMTKSIVASFVALTMGISGAFAQEFSFSNEVSSDLVTITKADDTEKDFAGISEKAEFEFKSEKVDAGVMVEFTIDDYGADEGYGFKWTDYNYLNSAQSMKSHLHGMMTSIQQHLTFQFGMTMFQQETLVQTDLQL